MQRARLITLEGIEGVGKSTHLGFVADYLAGRGHRTLITREPGGTRTGEAIREVLLHRGDLVIAPVTELLLMFAARAQHLLEVVLPALSAGTTVICDRFIDATYAYQGGGRGIPHRDIRLLEEYVQHGLAPDLTLLFDTSVATGRRRAAQRGPVDRFEAEETAFFESIRQAYLDRARQEPARIKVIDAERDIAAVQQDIIGILEAGL